MRTMETTRAAFGLATKPTSSEATEKFLDDLRMLIQDGQHLLKQGKTGFTEGGYGARQKFLDTVETLQSAYEDLQDKTVACTKATARVVREHPYQTTGVLLGIAGLVAGLLVARR